MLAGSQRHIDVLGDRTLSDDSFLLASSQKGTPEYLAIETALKGPEFGLPAGVGIADKEGHVRTKSRAKWWNSLEGQTYRSLSFPEQPELPEIPVADSAIADQWDIYPETSAPVFVGHYWLPPQQPAPFRNVICLDYSVAKNGFLAGYRLNPNQTISPEHFVTSVNAA